MIKIFMDGAQQEQVRKADRNVVQGFTTNPTLMRQRGVKDYESYARAMLTNAEGLPVSLEVFADDHEGMIRQGLRIASWGKNAWVKIPICNTQGELTIPVISALLQRGVFVNVTAVMSKNHIADLAQYTSDHLVISVFAGRIADTGRDAAGMIHDYVIILNVPVLWASPRQILDVLYADEAGCQIITMPPEMIDKMQKLQNKDLDEYSIETSRMFYNDARAAGYVI
jgi:transaldolase